MSAIPHYYHAFKLFNLFSSVMKWWYLILDALVLGLEQDKIVVIGITREMGGLCQICM
jgi:hypothetical protein